MEKEYKIIIKEDGSYRFDVSEKDFNNSVKDLLSFSLQYCHSFFTPDDMNLSESSSTNIKNVIESLNISDDEIEEFKKIIMRFGVEVNSKLMIHNNGLPKNWE
jgi:hypothetical protein